MSATERRKGARGEVDLVNWLRFNGWPDARRYLAGDGRQPGDIDGVPGVCIEMKNCSKLDLAGWLRQVEEAAGDNLPMVVIKPRGVVDPGRFYVLMRLEDVNGLLT